MKRKLEILSNRSWIEVTRYIFRSYTGPRRINGKPYNGPRYYLGTNDQSYGGVIAEWDGADWVYSRSEAI
jgi:hypothetical protein